MAKKEFRDNFGRLVAKSAPIVSYKTLSPEFQKDIESAYDEYKNSDVFGKESFTFFYAKSRQVIYVEGVATSAMMENRAFLFVEGQYTDPELELFPGVEYFNYYAIVEGPVEELKMKYNFNSSRHLIDQFINFDRDMSEDQWMEIKNGMGMLPE